MVQDDKSVEVFHLRNNAEKEDSKLIGAISNRTFNYYTQRDGDATPCNVREGDDNIAIYSLPKWYIYEDLNNNQLKIEDLGPYNNFWIEWYNALTGDFIVPTLLLSNVWGNAFLEFPDSLTGDATAPILIFKLFPTDEPFLIPLSGNDFETSLPLEFSKDEIIPAVEITNWTINVDSISLDKSLNVIVSPNPTQGKINIQITEGMVNQCDWSISNENGAIILNGVENTSIFAIDLSDFTSGTYFLNIHSNGEKSTTKIIKL
jgi:hypothetical protein